ncbi:Succinate dehydrogenase assembly factor 1; mitochondrial [Camelus dromedarius]|uniref:Succinate dehydrogenase assembly factor 1 n=3 Tax=Camelus TaxID=9836 RepID=A0A5N4DSL0_CAMDR|nr:succinate dehydrogenase assembly factor 1, mitochondrial [Camelus bactrianus]XP_010977159.1 succinate dehydrogenase assembly factor 1, mitochondrial [Camelus dromedarius]XP_014414525.1 LOW QUALITY PROTEIN: succinate dehydrogenase assembly factor 1, mitochondrial [Camelus ferus]EPY81223.1 succinate dehydrogenase assembly factor 1, mitochondrial [Camelus ferus]KAB1273960.1 Succinate dehydrogenase assembly factor 1; mitochondrial [Camelus dromedarius]
MSRPSRLQRQVLSLYRELLRAGRGKPGAEARVRAEFRQHASLPRSDVLRIEYLYRRGRRQLQLLRSGHAKAMGAFVRLGEPIEETRGAGTPGTPPDVDDGPRRPLDSMGAPETPSEGR